MSSKNDAVKNNEEQQIEQILDSFRSPFWLVEHRWFVQCDWSPVSQKYYVYTLPYTFENFSIDFPICSKFTCPTDHYRWSYNHVRRLTYTSASYLYECLTLSDIQFSNIEHITIELPRNNHFRYRNQQLDQITSLPVSLTDDYEKNCLNQLQLLLDRYPRLTSLQISEWPSAILNLPQYKITNVLVSELNLRCHHGYTYWYTEEQCYELSRSILGTQCKILTIDAENRACVRDLIIRMKNLIVLNVRCRHVKWNLNVNTGEPEEDLVRWLQENLQDASAIIKNVACRKVKDQKNLFIERS